MTRKTPQWQRWTKLPLAVAVAAGMSGQAAAYSFYVGDVEAQFNTTLSAGAGWRVENPDARLISQGNLGPEFAPGGEFENIGASSNNYDDGNLNFERGHTYSKIVRGNSELYLNYSVDNPYLTRVGAFVRGRYWYDFELKDEKRAVDNVGQRRELNSEASDYASLAEILDAYVFSDWYIGNVPVSIRYGEQVVSWGESTFIPGGINVINPVDVPAFRAPGSQLKDALLPVEMFYMSAGITENVSVETFVQTDWEPVRPDYCGTFFSTNDFAADGCGPVLLAGQLPDSQAYAQGFVAPRLGDKEADAKDQFGVALRWYVPALNDSELGFYYIKYNSRLPYVSGQVNNPSNPAAAQQNDPSQSFSTFPSYFIEYPENINLYGISINTTTPGGWSLGAEYSFRDNLPLQWNAFELIYGGLQKRGPNGEVLSLLEQQMIEKSGNANFAGEAVSGYDRFNVSQAQFTLIKFFDQVMGASRLSLITEFGATYVHDLPGYDEARYGRSGTFGIGTIPSAVGDLCSGEGSADPENINTTYCNNEGFTTDFSWGYRTRLVWDYPNALAGVNLSPQLAWSHDVEGYSPQPGGAFNEGSKAIGLSLQAVYQNRITGNIGYTNFFGGKPYNELTDRDFVNASVSYSF
ncbi:MAG: peptide ABC transporter substrate-binding protein [Marinobacter sp.]|nr:peptide ABC transporter substrate-binding protein [Marinobacter sp.]